MSTTTQALKDTIAALEAMVDCFASPTNPPAVAKATAVQMACRALDAARDVLRARAEMGQWEVVFPEAYGGAVYAFDYCEMVELTAAGRDATQGNECLEAMKKKAFEVFCALPDSDY